jgi:hypothetical protein
VKTLLNTKFGRKKHNETVPPNRSVSIFWNRASNKNNNKWETTAKRGEKPKNSYLIFFTKKNNDK